MARGGERRRRRRRMHAHRPESRAAGSPESRRRSRSPHRQSGGSACRRIALPTVAPGLPSGHRPDAMPLRRPSSPRRPSESHGAFFPACAKGSTFSIVGRIDPRPRGRCMGFLVNPGCPILAEPPGAWIRTSRNSSPGRLIRGGFQRFTTTAIDGAPGAASTTAASPSTKRLERAHARGHRGCRLWKPRPHASPGSRLRRTRSHRSRRDHGNGHNRGSTVARHRV